MRKGEPRGARDLPETCAAFVPSRNKVLRPGTRSMCMASLALAGGPPGFHRVAPQLGKFNPEW